MLSTANIFARVFYLGAGLLLFGLFSQFAYAHGMSEAEKLSINEGGNLRYMWLGAPQSQWPRPGSKSGTRHLLASPGASTPRSQLHGRICGIAETEASAGQRLRQYRHIQRK